MYFWKIPLFLISLAIIFALTPAPAYAQTLTINKRLDIVSTNCTGGTKVFGGQVNSEIRSLYITKDNLLIYANRDYQDVFNFWSVLCLENVILIQGISNAWETMAAITANGETFSSKQIAAFKSRAKILSSPGQVRVQIYSQWPKDENSVGQEIEFNKPFLVPEQYLPHPVNFSSSYTPVNAPKNASKRTSDKNGDRGDSAHSDSGNNLPAELTTMSSCYNAAADVHYTAISYTWASASANTPASTTQNAPNNPHAFLDVVALEDFYTGPASIFITGAELPFIATNSMCIEGDTYLFGKNSGKQEAAKISFNPEQKKFKLDPISPQQAPLRPFVE